MNILKKIKERLIRLSVESRKETPEEKSLREELRASIAELPASTRNSENDWERYRAKLREYILANDPRNFLRWAPITGSMFHTADRRELAHLMGVNRKVWQSAIQEAWIGNPPKYAYYPKSSGNLVHIAYNLSQLIDSLSIDLREIRSIVEFGAGYGCMARLTRFLGFKGSYTIFDLPEFLALQRYYLKASGTNQSLELVSDIRELKDLDPDIFIATWSLSESPLDVRESFLQKIGAPKYVLIAYQETFGSIDNKEYFSRFRNRNPNYEWAHYEIEQLPGNYYLIGKRKI